MLVRLGSVSHGADKAHRSYVMDISARYDEKSILIATARRFTPINRTITANQVVNKRTNIIRRNPILDNASVARALFSSSSTKIEKRD